MIQNIDLSVAGNMKDILVTVINISNCSSSSSSSSSSSCSNSSSRIHINGVCKRNRAGNASISLRLDDREIGVRFFAHENDFCSFHIVQTGLARHPAVYPDRIMVTFLGVKRSRNEVDHSP
jgi:hypothetical protein